MIKFTCFFWSNRNRITGKFSCTSRWL